MSDADGLNKQLDKLLYKTEAGIQPISKTWNFDLSLLTRQKQERLHTFIDSLKVTKERDSPEIVKQRTHLRASLDQLIDIFANLDYSSAQSGQTNTNQAEKPF